MSIKRNLRIVKNVIIRRNPKKRTIQDVIQIQLLRMRRNHLFRMARSGDFSYIFCEDNFTTNNEKSKVRSSTLPQDSLGKYLQAIHKIPVLTRLEQSRLMVYAVDGDEIARKKLVLTNLRFVVHIANKYKNVPVSMLDLINEGNIGLIEAINCYDINKGTNILSYAVWKIRQNIMLFLYKQNSLIRLPLNKIIDINNLRKAEQRYLEENGLVPTDEDLSLILEKNINYISLLRKLSKDSVEVSSSGNDNTQYYDAVDTLQYTPEKVTANHELVGKLESLVGDLIPVEKQIIEMRFALNTYEKQHSLQEVSDHLSLSRESVRKIEKKVLEKLKKLAESKHLQDFL